MPLLRRCGSGCDTASFFNSADHLLPFALQTGRLEIRSNAVAARVLVDGNGLAKGVQYFDRVTGAEQQVLGKVVVLGASTVDSTRILLNSTSDKYPNGIGNGSDVIGRYLCEQIRFHARGILPELVGTATRNDRGIGGEHVYMPRFNHRPGRKRDYLRGFGAQFWNTGASASGAHGGSELIPGFGASLKKEIKRRHPAWFEIHPYGEVLPYAHNRVTVDPNRKDRYGVPLPSIDYRIGENERKMAEHMNDTVEEIVKAAGGELIGYKRGDLDRNGSAIHEHGTCRMGADPKRSALNAIQSDARGQERVRGGRIGIPECHREEPDADHPRAVVARNRLPRRADQARRPLMGTRIASTTPRCESLAAGGVLAPRPPRSGSTSSARFAREQAVHTHATIAAAAQTTCRMDAEGPQPPTSCDTVATLSELDHPADRHAGRASDAASIASSMASSRRRRPTERASLPEGPRVDGRTQQGALRKGRRLGHARRSRPNS